MNSERTKAAGCHSDVLVVLLVCFVCETVLYVFRGKHEFHHPLFALCHCLFLASFEFYIPEYVPQSGVYMHQRRLMLQQW